MATDAGWHKWLPSYPGLQAMLHDFAGDGHQAGDVDDKRDVMLTVFRYGKRIFRSHLDTLPLPLSLISKAREIDSDSTVLKVGEIGIVSPQRE